MSTTVTETNLDSVVPINETNTEVGQCATQALEVSQHFHPGRPTRDQRGLVTAEWAVGIIAAAGLAGVLIAVITSGPVQSALLKVILHFISAVADKF
jgi:Protein of unknown function (DUF4244)